MSDLNVHIHTRTPEIGPWSQREPIPGSTPVSGVGETVAVSRTFESEDVYYGKRRLPHFEKPWTIYAVTMSTRARRKLSPSARTIVLNALLHFHLKRYEMFAACVMPDHVHLIFQPWPKEQDQNGNSIFWSISHLSHSVKSFTAHQINKLERTTGALWEEEGFDRYIRSESDLAEKFNYVCHNPWEAKIADPKEGYPWLWTWHDDLRSGSAPVSGVGESVTLSQSSEQSSFRRDAETHARDERAPQNPEHRVHPQRNQ